MFDELAQSVPEFLSLPIEFVGAILYQMVNIPVQVIVRLTGLTGNQIIPPPPGRPGPAMGRV